MRWTYDVDARAAYIYLSDYSLPVARQLVLVPGQLIVDVAEDGTPVGVELLSVGMAIDTRVLAHLGLSDAEVIQIEAIIRAGLPIGFGAGTPPTPPSFGPADKGVADVYESELELSLT
ncbi:MAG: DUF2283 domain-containing protein [Acidimicrobiales bacterium]|jgi:uncharacterized protein YuzE